MPTLREAIMDEFLSRLGLYRKVVARDGSCLFRVVSEQLYYTQFYHEKVRRDCVNFMRRNRSIFETYVEGSYDKYLERIEDPTEAAGLVEIKALSLLHRRHFVIYRYPGSPPEETDDHFEEKILLCYSTNKHCDIVYPKTYVPAAQVCQALLYELLYTKILGVNPNDLQAAIEERRSRRHRNSHSLCSDEGGYDSNDKKREDGSYLHHDEARLEMDELKSTDEAFILTLSSRVFRSLDPNVYRNVEFDVWHMMRRELRKSVFVVIAGQVHYLGDKCQVRLEPKGRYYNAFIQEVDTEVSVTVFIQELGERLQVALDNVKPVSPLRTWQVTPVTQGTSSGQYCTEQEYEVRGRRRFSRRFRAVAVNMPAGRPAGFHSPPAPPRGAEYEHYRSHPSNRSHRGPGSPWSVCPQTRDSMHRHSSRFVNPHHLTGPKVSCYHSAAKRCNQSFENYSFRPRVRRHIQTIAKECQFTIVPSGAEEVQDMGGPVTFRDIDRGNQNSFSVLQGQPVGRPMMPAASYWVPTVCSPPPAPREQAASSSEEDTDDRSTGGEQGKDSGEYVYSDGDAGFESPSVYSALESTANLTIQEGGSALTQEGAATYSYSQQVVVQSAMIPSSQPVTHATIFTANSSSTSSSRSSDMPPDSQPTFNTHHGQPPAPSPGIFVPYSWYVEMAEAVGITPPPPFSYDPNGDDLPEDSKVIQYYFNLGVQCYQSYFHSMVGAHQMYQQQGTEEHRQSYPSNAFNHNVPESYAEPGMMGHNVQPEPPAHGPPLSLDPVPSGSAFYPLVQEPPNPPTTYYVTTWIPGQPWVHSHPIHHSTPHPPHNPYLLHNTHPGPYLPPSM